MLWIFNDISIWISDRKLKPSVSQDVPLIIPTKYFLLAILTVSEAAQTKNLGVVLVPSVFAISLIPSIVKSNLKMYLDSDYFLPAHCCHVGARLSLLAGSIHSLSS